MIKNLILSMLLFSLFISCVSVARLKTDDSPEISAGDTSPELIEVYSTSDIGREFEIIGQVISSADAGSNSQKAVGSLRKQAARLGADAIVELRLEIDTGYWASAIKATGTAVKFK